MTAMTVSPIDVPQTTNTWEEILRSIPRVATPQVSWHRSSAVLHCRRAHRIAFPETLHVVGLSVDPGNGHFVTDSDVMIARGRDISVGGVSFQHNEPLPHQFVAVSFRSPFGTRTLVAKLSWCRYASEGHYMSGGRLIDNPQCDFEVTIDWDSLAAS